MMSALGLATLDRLRRRPLVRIAIVVLMLGAILLCLDAPPAPFAYGRL